MLVANQLRGKKSKASGAMFETLISRSCAWYQELGTAKISKQEEPMKPIRAYAAGRFLACYTKKSGVDYKGVLKGGRAVAFEAKHTDTQVMERSRLEEWQLQDLRDYSRLGAETFVLLSFGLERFYRIPFAEWDGMKERFGKVSVREKDIAEYIIEYSGRVLKFLKGVAE